jgi:hypothetical protein
MRGKESSGGPRVKRQADEPRDSACHAKPLAYPPNHGQAQGFTLPLPGRKPSLAPTYHESVMESGANPEQSRCGDRLQIPSSQSFPKNGEGGRSDNRKSEYLHFRRSSPASRFFPGKRVQWSSAKEDRREMAADFSARPSLREKSQIPKRNT